MSQAQAPAAVPPAPPVPVWNCEFFQDGGGPQLDSLTVGAKFGWKCHGDIAVAWPGGNPQLAFAKPEDGYTLAILKVIRLDPNDAQFVVTGYKPGDHKPEYVRVLQGAGEAQKGFEVSKPQWQIKSVLNPQKPPTPVPPFGPWTIPVPLWFLVSVFLGLVLAIYLIARRVRKHLQRKRMLESLKRHNTSLPPLHQFYRDARQISRRLHNVKNPDEIKQISSDLNREFRLFVLRKFQIPTLDWSDREILRDLRRRHRDVYKNSADSLRKTLRELVKMSSREKIETSDLEQLYRMSMDAAEKLETPSRGARA